MSNNNNNNDRIVVLVDMDCFFCQVEAKLQPEYMGKPLAVVQYNQWQMGGIIAVNYEAREFGVTRHMRGDEAKEKCPDLILSSVPCLRGKSDTSRYRSAGRDVINVIKEHCNVIERASVDEAYLDITDIVNKRMSEIYVSPKVLMSRLSNTFVVGYSETGKNDEEERQKDMLAWLTDIFEESQDVQSQKLAIAGMIVEELRADIFKKTGFRCSAGIAQNKILSKLACGLHKPNRQTILPVAAIPNLYATLPVKKVRNLGGKFGDAVIESLNCNVMGDLLQYSLQYLQKRFDNKTGSWLYNIARGIDNEPVVTRLVCKSIGACKKFPGKQAIVTIDVLKHWAGELAAEVCERLEQDLEENQRRATLLTICYHYYQNKKAVSQSRSCVLNSYKPEKMANQCVEIITKSTQCPVAYLGISAGKFVESKNTGNFIKFFKTDKLKNKTELISNALNATQTHSNAKKMENIVSDVQHTISTDIISHELTERISCNNTLTNEKEYIMEDKHLKGTKELLPTPTLLSGVNLNESPTSRKVNRLIKYCNERNNIYVQNVYDVPSKSFTIDKSLKSDNFKESFFINMLKDEGIMSTEKMMNVNQKQVEKSDHDNTSKFNTTFLCMTNSSDNIEQTTNDREISSLKQNPNINIQSDENKHTHEYNSFMPASIEETYNKSESVQDNRILGFSTIQKETEQDSQALLQKTNLFYSDISEKILNQPTNENTKLNVIQNSLTQLQEIFPDLNDIDLNILSLLPYDLQQQAKSYLNVQKQSEDKYFQKNSVVLTKTLKIKTNKAKTNISKDKKLSSMKHFLINKTKSSSSNEIMKECPECNQIIPTIRYNEHTDFHVAENLQKQINKSTSNDMVGKRKMKVSAATVKRVAKTDIEKKKKESPLITAFLS